MKELQKEELMRGIDEDDVEIHRCERILGYNKRKSKNIPKVFRVEGLDCTCVTSFENYNLLQFNSFFRMQFGFEMNF